MYPPAIKPVKRDRRSIDPSIRLGFIHKLQGVQVVFWRYFYTIFCGIAPFRAKIKIQKTKFDF